MCTKFFSSVFLSTEFSTIANITLNSGSLLTSTIGSQQTVERERAWEGGIYNCINRCYCSGRLSNGKIFLSRILWFCNGCARFNKKKYYCQQDGLDWFATHHASLVCHHWHVFCFCSILFWCLICNKDDFLGWQLAAIMSLVPIRIYKRHDLSL